MSETRTAPPPRKAPPAPAAAANGAKPTDAQRAAAAAKVSAAFAGGADPLGPKTGAVDAGEIKQRARARSVTPAAAAPAATGAAKADPAPTERVDGVVVELARICKDLAGVIKTELKKAVETVLAHGDETRAQLGEALAVLQHPGVEPPDGADLAEAADYDAIRVVVKNLPAEPEWVDEWCPTHATTEVPAERLEAAATALNVVRTFEEGVAICRDYLDPDAE